MKTNLHRMQTCIAKFVSIVLLTTVAVIDTTAQNNTKVEAVSLRTGSNIGPIYRSTAGKSCIDVYYSQFFNGLLSADFLQQIVQQTTNKL